MTWILHASRQVFLAAKARIVNETNAAHPVAVLEFALSFRVVLTTDEVPHKITPKHPSTLIINEVTEILTKSRNHHTFIRAVWTFLRGDAHLRFVNITLVSVCKCFL